MPKIHIEPIKSHHIAAVRSIIFTCVLEFKILPFSNHVELEAYALQTGCYDDLSTIQETYFDHRGAFFVLLDNDKVAGSGAIKYLNDEACELKRMFFLMEKIL